MILSHNWTTSQPDNPNLDVSARNLNDHFITLEASDYLFAQPIYVLGHAQTTLTGSIDPTASANVVGVGTLFTTELQVGDRILVTGLTRTVVTITDNTHLTVDVAFTNVANDTAPKKLWSSLIVQDSTGKPSNMVFSNGSSYFRSNATDSSINTAVTIDTYNTFTVSAGNLLKINNNEVNKITIDAGGNFKTVGNFQQIGTINSQAGGYAYGSNWNLTNPAGNVFGEFGGLSFQIFYLPTGGAQTLHQFSGLNFVSQSSGTGLIDNVYGIRSNMNTGTNPVTTFYNLYLVGNGNNVATYDAIHIEPAPAVTGVAHGVVLHADGPGNDVTFGLNYESVIYHDGNIPALVVDPVYGSLTGTENFYSTRPIQGAMGFISSTAAPGIAATITTAKLTTIGTNGSMTFVDGLLTAQTPAT